ncbi:polysaccharide biosynthesis tyrosine autokinase [Chitinophagaceae bacterium LB-8]|uniref:non-specific protein-tyrosine kinase n=1 Tax=Paraflavisolibacter caeni TaxID=2982496 RepID=A0A9X2XTQ1_9BACT|nr:polysaccharide biosynthesis tyrosine autokinase [Paraflavisolibacter caeni]MCU7548262.1 polysaccharide biosynthesis tyrosine autokinase [Paraflavisolibacter caeni]
MSVKKIKTEEKEDSVLSFLLFRFAPYWPLFILLLLLCSIGAWFYLRFSTPLYEAYATILIKDEKKGVDDNRMLESLNIYTSSKIVENEMEIIRSRTLMKEVVKNLHLYAPVSEEGRFNKINAYETSPIKIEVKEPENIKMFQPDIPIYYDQKKSTVTLDRKSYPVGSWVNTPYGDLKFVLNPYADPDNNEHKQLYFSLFRPDNVASFLASRVGVQPTNKIATVLGLSFRDESASRAIDILNELIEVYSINSVKEKNLMAANTLTFIDERLRYVINDLDSIERSIQHYKTKEGIVNLSEQSKNFLLNVSDNDRQVSNINMQIAVLDQVERYVVSKNNDVGIVPSALGLNDQLLSQLLQKLYDAELEYDKLKKTMAENSPQVVAVASEIERIRPTILENVRNQRTSLFASKKNVSETSGAYNSYLKTIPQKERELLEISRQQSIKNNVYSFLLEKREETALASSSTLADSKLIDPALSNYSPVSPQNSTAYLSAFALSFIIGIALVCFKELFTGKILFRSDIEKYTRIPIAAEITNVKNNKSELVVNRPDKIFLTEQFQHLRAAIGLHGRVVSKQKVLITSSIAGEGKSFVAANLALSLSSSGKKVLLIDADLRGPKTTSIFNMEDREGLVEFLEGNVGVEDIIRYSDNNNLYVIPAGGDCNNPTEILLNGKLNELFTYIEELFDYILVDTSPVDPVTDAYVLSCYCDKTLFVIRHGYTPKTMVQILDESNKVTALSNPFIVFNGIKKRGFIKGSYGFGYGFGYEYVYKNRNGVKNRKVSIS